MLPYGGQFKGRGGYGRLLLLLIAIASLIWVVAGLVLR